MGIGNRIYGGMASFGVFMAFIGAIIATLIGIGLIYFGVSLATQDYDQVKAKVKNINAQNISITFFYKNKEQTQFLNSTKPVSVGDELLVYVGDDEMVSLDDPKKTGWVLAGVGAFIILAGWIWYWITKKYEFAAATSGLSNSLSIIRNVFN